MAIESGLLEQGFFKIESAYRTVPTLAATDAFRFNQMSLTAKLNREPSPEMRGTPDEAQSLPRRRSQGFDLSSMTWEPSGTLGTASDISDLIKGGFGARTTPGVVAEVQTSPTATGCTLDNASGLAVGDLIVATVGSGARREITRIKTISTNDITYDDLSAAPDVGAGKIVSGVNYKLASSLTDSFSIFKYLLAGGFKQAVYGAIVNRIQLTFDGTKEAMIAISGPAGEYARSGVQSKPSTYTTAGAPVGGMVGNFYVGTSAFLVQSAEITLENNLDLRNNELGTQWASGFFRTNKRQIRVRVSFYLEDTTLIAAAEGVTTSVLRLVVGDTNGSMLGAFMPAVEWEIPDVGNEVGPKVLTIEGKAYAPSGNDALYLCEA